MGYPLRTNSIRRAHLLFPSTGGKFGKHARGSRPHYGWDLTASPGTPVFAVGPGEILLATGGIPGYGKIIQLKFLTGSVYRYALYAHLSTTACKAGDHVVEGQVLGLTGMSGNARNEPPHLHFEIASTDSLKRGRQNYVDPAEVLGAFLKDNESGEARVTESSYPICLTPEQIDRAIAAQKTA
jgi:murein DD-endopeptidase MepM/ murein hydrolase activator NlpD